jgi:hypothetical protein
MALIGWRDVIHFEIIMQGAVRGKKKKKKYVYLQKKIQLGSLCQIVIHVQPTQAMVGPSQGMFICCTPNANIKGLGNVLFEGSGFIYVPHVHSI